MLVAPPRVEELQTLAVRLPLLREMGPEPELLLVGDWPYGSREVAATLGCQVLGVLADDRPAADELAGDPRGARMGRSRLLRSASSLVGDLQALTRRAVRPKRPNLGSYMPLPARSPIGVFPSTAELRKEQKSQEKWKA